MNFAVLFVQCSILIASYVYCARKLPVGYKYDDYNCFLLDEKLSKLADTELQLDRICLANDLKENKYVTCTSAYRVIETKFDDVKIVRMDDKWLTIQARIENDSYLNANVVFEDFDKVDEFISAVYPTDEKERTDVIDIFMVEKIWLFQDESEPPHWKLHNIKLKVSLKYVEYEENDNIYIMYASDDYLDPSTSVVQLKAYIVFSQYVFELSKAVYGKLVMLIHGFEDAYYILTFSQDKDAAIFRNSFIQFAATDKELEIPNEILPFLNLPAGDE